MSRKAFNAVVSRFLKDVLERFAITSVNDELVASAITEAILISSLLIEFGPFIGTPFF